MSTLWWQGDERGRRPWKAPQVAADLTLEDYRANNDPALKAALSYVPKKSLADLLRQAVSANDFAKAAAVYREWRADPVNAYAQADAEIPVNSLGYELMAAKRLDQAVEVLKLNAAAFPRSANAFDSLGEAYRTKGDRESAIRSYEKALELDPNMKSAADALKDLSSR